jgi:hypothetical protein
VLQLLLNAFIGHDQQRIKSNLSKKIIIMNDALKNPFLVFIAGLLAIWLVFKILKVIISIGWIIVLAFVILFIINPRFRSIVQHFFANIFKS